MLHSAALIIFFYYGTLSRCAVQSRDARREPLIVCYAHIREELYLRTKSNRSRETLYLLRFIYKEDEV
jgi:hypothetical protein